MPRISMGASRMMPMFESDTDSDDPLIDMLEADDIQEMDEDPSAPELQLAARKGRLMQASSSSTLFAQRAKTLIEKSRSGGFQRGPGLMEVIDEQTRNGVKEVYSIRQLLALLTFEAKNIWNGDTEKGEVFCQGHGLGDFGFGLEQDTWARFPPRVGLY